MISASPESTAGHGPARIVQAWDVDIEIGAMPIRICTSSPDFARLLEERYGGFVTPVGMLRPAVELHVDLAPPGGAITAEEDVTVRFESGQWIMQRGDFYATWDQGLRHGRVRQTANPYAIDAVLRILHSLMLAREGGFLVHAASAIRRGRAYLFAGVSGAGKTTLSRLAPPDVTVLTDEISYVRAVRSQQTGVGSRHETAGAAGHSYVAFGTPFAGELARIGENTQAPVAALYLLAQAPENRIEPVGETEAARALLRNILFFAEDAELVRQIFDSALEFVRHVPVRRLSFTPDERVWEALV
jgi:hypothetical protein